MHSAIAASLVSTISATDTNATATASGATVSLTSRVVGAAANYPLSASVSYDTGHFGAASFGASPSGGHDRGIRSQRNRSEYTTQAQ